MNSAPCFVYFTPCAPKMIEISHSFLLLQTSMFLAVGHHNERVDSIWVVHQLEVHGTCTVPFPYGLSKQNQFVDWPKKREKSYKLREFWYLRNSAHTINHTSAWWSHAPGVSWVFIDDKARRAVMYCLAQLPYWWTRYQIWWIARRGTRCLKQREQRRRPRSLDRQSGSCARGVSNAVDFDRAKTRDPSRCAQDYIRKP